MTVPRFSSQTDNIMFADFEMCLTCIDKEFINRMARRLFETIIILENYAILLTIFFAFAFGVCTGIEDVYIMIIFI